MPSFFAASTSSGVIATAGGAAARDGRSEHGAQCQRRGALQNIASGNIFALSSRPPCYRLSARQRSGGSVSQTSVPRGTAFSVDVTTRKVVPSGVSTM